MRFIEKAPIKRKQMLIILLITSIALLLACTAIGAYEVLNFRRSMLNNVTTLAQIIGDNSAAALDFDDPKAAEETLAALKAEPNIIGACIYDKNGRVFAEFDRAGDGRKMTPPPFQKEGRIFSRDELTLFRSIDYKGDAIGTVYIASDMNALYSTLERYAAIAGSVYAVTLLVAFLLSARLQRLVSDPILRLVQTTRAVARDRDYSIRVARHSPDEIGELIDGFNEMLTQIQQRDAVLQQAHSELEGRVRDRTQELASSLSLVHATLESTADGILVADGAGKATTWNKKFMQMWQLPREVLESGDERRMIELAVVQLKDPKQFMAKVEELYGHMDRESFDLLEFKDGRVFERYSQPQRIGDRSVGRVWSFRDVTERKRSEQQLQASLEELRLKTALFEALVNSSLDGILVVNEQAQKLVQNQQFNELLRIPEGIKAQSSDAEQVTYVENSTRNPEEFAKKVMHLYSHPDETSRDEIEFKDGRILDRYTAPVVGSDKKYYGRIWMFRDITERKRVEAELDYERELLRSLLNNSPDHVYFKDLESRFIKCSKKQAERFGAKSVDEVVGKTDFEFHLKEHASRAFEDEQRIIRTGQPVLDKVEKLFRKGENKISWALTSKIPLRNKKGEIIGTFGISKDITAIKEAEEKLAYERDLLATLMENSPDLIYFKDRESRYIKCGRKLAERFGAKGIEEVIGKTEFEFHGGQHARQGYEDEQQIIRTGEPIIGKIEKETWAGGKVAWVLSSKMPLRNKEGEVIGTFGISKDITAIKEAEEKLAYERDLLGTLMDNCPDMIYFKDRDSRFLRISRMHVERMGAKQLEEVVGRSDFDFFSEEHARAAFEDEQEIIRTGHPVIAKVEKETWENGEASWVLTSKMPLRNKDGEIIGTFGISKDITAMKEAEERLEQVHRQLLETSRMAGMAEVATSVLHNVGNVLNSVNVSCSVVADRVHKSKVANLSRAVALIREHEGDLPGFFADDPKGKQLPAYLNGLATHLATEQEEILRELAHLGSNIDHIKEIVAMQQSYSKVSGVRELLPASELAEDALRMNNAALERHKVKVVREYQETPLLMAEKHKVLQILINLLRNAKYACDDSGREDKQVTLRIEPADGNRVKLSVIDNGVGIPAGNLTRIFEHGFTTRKEGHGFGLHSGALAAKELGGSLTVASKGPGLGACFTLELPCQPMERKL